MVRSDGSERKKMRRNSIIVSLIRSGASGQQLLHSVQRVKTQPKAHASHFTRTPTGTLVAGGFSRPKAQTQGASRKPQKQVKCAHRPQYKSSRAFPEHPVSPKTLQAPLCEQQQPPKPRRHVRNSRRCCPKRALPTPHGADISPIAPFLVLKRRRRR